MNKKTFILLIVVVIVVNATGLLNDIFTGDSALYATISKSFSESGNYTDIYVQGKDWLDKPHFPFWMCAISMELLGANSFAYKFASFLFFLIGLFYTYKLAKRLYNKDAAQLAVLILGSTMHIIISNNDTRAEAILLGLIMGAVYHLYNLSLAFSTRDIVLAALFSAAAVMTKGIFALIIVYSAIFGDMLVKREFKHLFQLRWALVLLLTLVFTAPELYALYAQFDLHPERVVFGETGVSGIRFFFWDSQFGRFFNTGPIKGKGDLFFFAHTTLWALAPWAILGFTALIKSGISMFRKRQNSEYINFFGFFTMFLIFSISKFQLPHYLNIIFPFIAILTAALIADVPKSKVVTYIKMISVNLYILGFAIVVFFIAYFFRPNANVISDVIVLLCIFFLSIYFNFINNSIVYKYVVYGVLVTSLVFLYINLSFYPALLKYQSGIAVAQYANENFPSDDIVFTYEDYLLQFYSNNKTTRAFTFAELISEDTDENVLVYTENSILDSLTMQNIDYRVIESFDYFRITKLKMNFIDHHTRADAFDKRYLIRILNSH